MMHELLEIRASLQTALTRLDQLALQTGGHPILRLPNQPQLARTLYAQVQQAARSAGTPIPTQKHIRGLLLANGWTIKRTEHGTLLSPPAVGNLP